MTRSAWKRGVVGGLIAALALAGCTAQELEPEVDEATPVVEEPEEVIPEVPRHPLTGFEVAEGSVTGPAVMAKIDHENRPYVNLHRADIVWQQLIPQNGTRFLAIWHSDVPESVSYVRSFRPHDYTMAAPFGGILASTGLFSGVVPFLQALDEAGVKNVVWDYRGPDDRDLWRNTGKPYAAASSIEFAATAAQEQFASLAPPAQYFQYVSDLAETSAVMNGQSATSITVHFGESKTNNYTTSKWEWDVVEGVYKKVFINGEPVLSDNVDWVSGQQCGECVQLHAHNLVVLRVPHDDSVGQPTARFVAGDDGRAYVSTGGKTLEATWQSGAVGEPIRIFDEAGDEVKLLPGKTWVLVFPSSRSTAQTAGWNGPGSFVAE